MAVPAPDREELSRQADAVHDPTTNGRSWRRSTFPAAGRGRSSTSGNPREGGEPSEGLTPDLYFLSLASLGKTSVKRSRGSPAVALPRLCSLKRSRSRRITDSKSAKRNNWNKSITVHRAIAAGWCRSAKPPGKLEGGRGSENVGIRSNNSSARRRVRVESGPCVRGS